MRQSITLLFVFLVGCSSNNSQFTKQARAFLDETQACMRTIELTRDPVVIRSNADKLMDLYSHLPEPTWKNGKSAKDACRNICLAMNNFSDAIQDKNYDSATTRVKSMFESMKSVEFFLAN